MPTSAPPSTPSDPTAPAREAPATNPPSPSIAVRPPEFIAHTVAEGETLATISARYYGTETHAEAITRANPLASLTPLRAGRVIRIPRDPTNIQGRPLRPSMPDPPGKDREYTVREGDSLSKIAQLMYGDAGRADTLFNANRDQLSNRDTLRPGQRLRVPPLPTPDHAPVSDRP